MDEIEIYDSQGQPVGDSTGTQNEKIQDFFFAGVRLAIERRGPSTLLTVFFRARESEASRSEQYYAVYRTSSAKNLMQGFRDLFKQRIEQELGMDVVTTTEDTKVFETILDDSPPEIPGDSRDIKDIDQILNQGEQSAHLGVRTYPQAVGLLNELLRSSSANKVAISESRNTPHLEEYDIIVEKGDYAGITFLDNTKKAIEDLRERRRKRLQSTGPYSGPSGLKQYLPGFLQKHYLAFLSVSALLIIGVVIAGTLLGSCFLLGGSFPVVDNPACPADAGGDVTPIYATNITNTGSAGSIAVHNVTATSIEYKLDIGDTSGSEYSTYNFTVTIDNGTAEIYDNGTSFAPRNNITAHLGRSSTFESGEQYTLNISSDEIDIAASVLFDLTENETAAGKEGALSTQNTTESPSTTTTESPSTTTESSSTTTDSSSATTTSTSPTDTENETQTVPG